MKKDEAISILATSLRPREPKDRARYDEAVKMAIKALNCSEIPNSSDTISRQAAIDALKKMQTYKLFAGDDMLLIDQAEAQTELMMLPSVQPEPHEIGYSECANAMLKMWIDNVLTDGEYNRIMDKLNAHWAERREDG